MSSKTNTILLCAGKINYVNLPVSTNTSNSMIPVNGKPVIGWILEDLIAKNIDSITVVMRKEDVHLKEFLSRAFAHRMHLELVLLDDPDVTDAAVIGVPSEHWGETPLGLVVLRDGAECDGADICGRANERLGKSQRLSAVEIRDDLPRSSIGKILKRELRAPYWEKAVQ